MYKLTIVTFFVKGKSKNDLKASLGLRAWLIELSLHVGGIDVVQTVLQVRATLEAPW